MVKHSCIKCRAQYEDNDPDDYYCPPCNEIRKNIAKEIDSKIVPREKKMSPLQEYDASPKVRGFVHVKF